LEVKVEKKNMQIYLKKEGWLLMPIYSSINIAKRFQMIKTKLFLKQNIFGILMMLISIVFSVFLILFAPEYVKLNYLLFLYLFLFIVFLIMISKRKQDFLVFLFIISLSFTGFNINAKRYFPLLGNLIPWITIADLLLLVMVITELLKQSIKRSEIVIPRFVNKAFLLLIASFIFSYIFVAPKYFTYQSTGIFGLYQIITLLP
jgi:hypothetical protein